VQLERGTAFHHAERVEDALVAQRVRFHNGVSTNVRMLAAATAARALPATATRVVSTSSVGAWSWSQRREA
jgi:hypothetical protein